MTFSFPTRVEYGPGMCSRLQEFADELEIHRPLIVTDVGMAATGIVDRVSSILPSATIYDGVEPNPVESNVIEGAAQYDEAACDGIIGLGGGSSLDAAKIIGLAATHPGSLSDYDDNVGGDKLIGADIPPIIAVPTTAGTGSEVGRSGVITLKATGRKTVIFSPYLMPALAVCDPELTTGLPKNITAATGADALTHCIEAYLATGFHPMCDGIALHGAGLAFRYLRRAVFHGAEDIEARGYMMIAASMGATAFQKGLGATHSLAHPLSTVAGVPHGLANAILLPHVLRFNAEVVPGRLKDLGRALDIDVHGRSSEQSASEIIAAIDMFLREIGIPSHLSEVGVTPEMIDTLSRKALEDGCHQLNPRPCEIEDFRELYRLAM
ncbi:MAG: iron-containing alcohol dehydrogenase [Candidatus Latescibacteria bacterium]|jgi:4-hydroxybutyrate dehydrogenase|nr:iron-containing alcohol dehydrogenase [Candidatus Latescibacterota bacterium]